MIVCKAVIPVAGLGTRLLPATKAIPKEMVPVVRKPAVQWVVEAAVAAGIEQVVFVTSAGKASLEDHFDRAPILEQALAAKGKTELLEVVRAAGSLAKIVAVRQPEPLGLGHAVLMARAAIGDEPFAVILPDELVLADEPPLAQCLATARASGSPVVGLVRVPRAETPRYGIVAARPQDDRTVVIESAIEKPKADEAPSDLAIRGPYVLTPQVFDEIERLGAAAGGEIQLTDALDALARRGRPPLLGRILQGRLLDVGNALGFVQANVVLGLRDPEIGPALRSWLERELAD